MSNMTSIAAALAKSNITINEETKVIKTRKPRKVAPGTIDKLTTLGTVFCDPTDLLMDKIGNRPSLYARTMESMAWMMDNSIISAARTVLFSRYKLEETEHKNSETFSAFCQEVAADLDHSSLYESESNERTLAVLLTVARHWHEETYVAVNADNRIYEPKTLRAQLESEQPSKVDLGTRSNYRTLARIENQVDTSTCPAALKAKWAEALLEVNSASEDDKHVAQSIAKACESAYLRESLRVEAAERMYNSMVEHDETGNAQRAEGNKSLVPTIMEILRTASRYADDSFNFDHLPHVVQKRLVTFTVGSLSRAQIDVAKKLRKQPLEFARVSESAYQCNTALNNLLKTKFADAGEMENITSQVQINMDRNAKRKAVFDIG